MERETEIIFGKEENDQMAEFNKYIETINNDLLEGGSINASTFFGIMNSMDDKIKKTVFSLFEANFFLNNDFLEKTMEIKAPLKDWVQLSFSMSTRKQGMIKPYVEKGFISTIKSELDGNYIKDPHGNTYRLGLSEADIYKDLIDKFDNEFKNKTLNVIG